MLIRVMVIKWLGEGGNSDWVMVLGFRVMMVIRMW